MSNELPMQYWCPRCRTHQLLRETVDGRNCTACGLQIASRSLIPPPIPAELIAPRPKQEAT